MTHTYSHKRIEHSRSITQLIVSDAKPSAGRAVSSQDKSSDRQASLALDLNVDIHKHKLK